MPLDSATLTISADVDGDGTPEEGTFVFRGDLSTTWGTRTGYLVGGRGSNVNSIISRLAGDGQSKRKGYYVDLGSGEHIIELSFTGWAGARAADDTPLQWGNTGNPDTLTVADATGADPITQLQVLDHYIQVGIIDSNNPARLEIGEYSPGGLFDDALGKDHLDVVLEQPRFERNSKDPSTFDGKMTCIEAASLSEPADATERLEG